MKIEISDKGFLRIERAGKMKTQSCPYHPDTFCGDWCPLFGEPVYLVFADQHLNQTKTSYIKLCQNILYADKIIDNRK